LVEVFLFFLKGLWDLSEQVRNAPCFCLLNRETVLEEEEEEEEKEKKEKKKKKKKKKKGEGVMWGKEQGEIAATYKNHRGRTDRHTRRSAVLTIICGGRAVGAGCNSNHNNNNQREGSVKLQRAPHQ